MTGNLVLTQLKIQNSELKTPIVIFFFLKDKRIIFCCTFVPNFVLSSSQRGRRQKRAKGGIQNLSYSQDSSQDFYLYTDIHPFTTDVASGTNPIGYMGNAAYQ